MKYLAGADEVTSAFMEGALTSFGIVGLAIPALAGLLLARLPTPESVAAQPGRSTYPQGNLGGAPIRTIEERPQRVSLTQQHYDAMWNPLR